MVRTFDIDPGELDIVSYLTFALRSLYARRGYRRFRMSKFEEYDLYAGNRDFLVSGDIITFTDTNGKLMALKPDVTLSIIKNAKIGKRLPCSAGRTRFYGDKAGGSRMHRRC